MIKKNKLGENDTPLTLSPLNILSVVAPGKKKTKQNKTKQTKTYKSQQKTKHSWVISSVGADEKY